jgi:hypothetical protein
MTVGTAWRKPSRWWQQGPSKLTRTSLVKLLYFVNLRNWERSGEPLTNVKWRWHLLRIIGEAAYGKW